MAEPAVDDLDYPTDQRMVATLVLGLKLLADSIDDIHARLAQTTRPPEVVDDNAIPLEMHDITAEIRRHQRAGRKTGENTFKKAAKDK